MTRPTTFQEDCTELLVERYRKGTLSRRQLLAGLGALGLAPMVGATRAMADVPDVVMANWGGAAEIALGETFGAHYNALTGGRIVMDGSGPSNGKIRAMVEANAVTWDICDAGAAGLGELGPLGMLEDIDYSVVDRSRGLQEFMFDQGVGNYLFSFVTAWDTERVSGKPTPADFFDVENIPGMRMIRRDVQPMIELALMADGVAPDQLYPLDVERAFAKIMTIKDHLLFWDNGTQSQELLRTGEAVMGWMWHTRANILKQETEGRIDWSFDGGVLLAGLWLVPKGAPNAAQAMQAIATFQDPEPQAGLLAALGNGPTNPEADALITPEMQLVNPGAPANQAVQAKMSFDWWMTNYADVLIRYRDLIAS